MQITGYDYYGQNCEIIYSNYSRCVINLRFLNL